MLNLKLPKLLKLKKTAELLGLSLNTINKRLKDGTIQGGKIGRQYRIMGVDLINAVRKEYKRYIIK